VTTCIFCLGCSHLSVLIAAASFHFYARHFDDQTFKHASFAPLSPLVFPSAIIVFHSSTPLIASSVKVSSSLPRLENFNCQSDSIFFVLNTEQPYSLPPSRLQSTLLDTEHHFWNPLATNLSHLVRKPSPELFWTHCSGLHCPEGRPLNFFFFTNVLLLTVENSEVSKGIVSNISATTQSTTNSQKKHRLRTSALTLVHRPRAANIAQRKRATATKKP